MLIEYSDNGYFDLGLFLMRTDNELSVENIKDSWDGFYKKAQEYGGENDNIDAEYLSDGAELCFEKAKKLSETDERKGLCEKIVTD